jgi:hypothetical protein
MGVPEIGKNKKPKIKGTNIVDISASAKQKQAKIDEKKAQEQFDTQEIDRLRLLVYAELKKSLKPFLSRDFMNDKKLKHKIRKKILSTLRKYFKDEKLVQVLASQITDKLRKDEEQGMKDRELILKADGEWKCKNTKCQQGSIRGSGTTEDPYKVTSVDLKRSIAGEVYFCNVCGKAMQKVVNVDVDLNKQARERVENRLVEENKK